MDLGTTSFSLPGTGYNLHLVQHKSLCKQLEPRTVLKIQVSQPWNKVPKEMLENLGGF